MNILITGGTGFVGSALGQKLYQAGHQLVVKTRGQIKPSFASKIIRDLSDLGEDEHFDVVINLAGEPIADHRWSVAQQQKIIDSRVHNTQGLIHYFQSCRHKPKVFISASAIGYYGIDRCNQSISEDGGFDASFSSQLCQRWEALASQAEDLGIRTCLIRIGIVLGNNGGALAKMLLPFKLGVGGKIGDGRQWMSWIHLQDLCDVIEFCIDKQDIRGPINATAPIPVTNLVFTQTLAAALKRPSIVPMPAFIIALLMGQMGQELLLAGKAIVPNKLLQAGYDFKYTELEQALRQIVSES